MPSEMRYISRAEKLFKASLPGAAFFLVFRERKHTMRDFAQWIVSILVLVLINTPAISMFRLNEEDLPT